MEKMEITKLIAIVIGTFLGVIGTCLIYDCRIITKKIFSFTDQNEGVFILKMVGFTLFIIGGFLIFFR